MESILVLFSLQYLALFLQQSLDQGLRLALKMSQYHPQIRANEKKKKKKT